MTDHQKLVALLDQLQAELNEDMNPPTEDLECFWCRETHPLGFVCPFAPYYIEEKADD